MRDVGAETEEMKMVNKGSISERFSDPVGQCYG